MNEVNKMLEEIRKEWDMVVLRDISLKGWECPEEVDENSFYKTTWIISNKTDEGLGPEPERKFRARTPLEAIKKAYNSLG